MRWLLFGVELRAPTPAAVGTPKPTNVGGDDEEPPLNEDDDDDDDLDDLEQGEEEPTTQHLVLAQFDKVGFVCDPLFFHISICPGKSYFGCLFLCDKIDVMLALLTIGNR